MKTKFTFLCACLIFILNNLNAGWEPILNLPENQLGADIAIVNQDIIWVLSTQYDVSTPNCNAHVLRSINGGLSWEEYEIPGTISNTITVDDISATDSLNAWVLCLHKGIYRTGNGGKTWTKINDKLKDGMFFHFFNENEGLAVENVDKDFNFSNDDSTRILKTFDGGYNWQLIDTPVTGGFKPFENFYFGSSNNIFQTLGDTVCFATALGRIFVSYDRGNTWKAFNSGLGENEYLTSIAMKSSTSLAVVSIGKIVVQNGIIIVENHPAYVSTTQDGGITWNNNKNINLSNSSIDFIKGSDSSYLISDFNSSKATSMSVDNGKTFFPVDESISFNSVEFFSPSQGFALSYNPDASTKRRLYKWTNSYNMLYPSLKSATVHATGDTSTINIISNIPWNVKSNFPWLTFSKSTGSNNEALTFYVEANPTNKARSASIDILGEKVTSKKIYVLQEAGAGDVNVSETSKPKIYFQYNMVKNSIQFNAPSTSVSNNYFELFDFTGRQILSKYLPAIQQEKDVYINIDNRLSGIFIVRLKVGNKVYLGKVLMVK